MLIVSVSAIAVIVIAGAALVVRSEFDTTSDGSAAAPPSLTADSSLGESGYGAVVFGQSAAEFRRAVCGGPCQEFEVATPDFESSAGCQLQQWSDLTGMSSPATWAWLIDDRVVAVGISSTDSRADVRTWPDIALGERFGLEDPRLAGWTWDETAPVPVARWDRDGLVTTLADTEFDGRLDYASVATTAADACEVPPEIFNMRPDPGAAVIDGGTVSGVSIGMSREEVLDVPDWRQEPGMSRGEAGPGGCEMLFSAAGPAAASLRDEIVVGVQGSALNGGPQVGQVAAEAMALIPGADLTVAEVAAMSAHEFLYVQGAQGEGWPVRVGLYTPPRYVAGLVMPAYLPGSAVVVEVIVGEDCHSAPG